MEETGDLDYLEEARRLADIIGLNDRLEEFLSELSGEVDDPIHRRLLEAYRDEDPLRGMEAELARIVNEVLGDEA